MLCKRTIGSCVVSVIEDGLINFLFNVNGCSTYSIKCLNIQDKYVPNIKNSMLMS